MTLLVVNSTLAALFFAAALQLPSGVHLIPGSFTPGTQPDGNSIVFDGRDGLVVFDTGRHPEHTRKILDIARDSRKPVAAIINSHWHLDHIGAIARFVLPIRTSASTRQAHFTMRSAGFSRIIAVSSRTSFPRPATSRS